MTNYGISKNEDLRSLVIGGIANLKGQAQDDFLRELCREYLRFDKDRRKQAKGVLQ